LGTDDLAPQGHFTNLPAAVPGTLRRRLQLEQLISIFCATAAGAGAACGLSSGIFKTVPQPHLALRPARAAVTGMTLLHFGHWTRI